MKKIVLSVDGMTCSACSNGLEKYLNKQNGVYNASVNLVMANASIEYDEKILDVPKIELFIKKAGFESLGVFKEIKTESRTGKEKITFVVFTVLAAALMYISMGHMLKLPVPEILDMHTHPVNYAVTLLLLTSTFLAYGGDILKNGYKNLVHGSPNMDTLVGIGVISSFLYSLFGLYMVLRGNNDFTANLYFESSATVIYFIKLGRYIDGISKDKTKDAIQKLVKITPDKAVVKINGEEKTVTLDQIHKGDILISRPGEKIAVDGEIVLGKAHLDESFITGESKPRSKETGDGVIAGSMNYDGYLEYKAERIGRESTVSEIVRLVVEAGNTKAPIAKTADTVSGYFVPAVMAIAVITFIVYLLMGQSFGTALTTFVTVLIVACPCSLGLATPLAVVVSEGLCAGNGILVKKSEILENAQKVNTVVFDKTGTLTYGSLKIAEIVNYGDTDNERVIKLAGSIESKSTHPIGKAFTDYMKENKIESADVSDFENIAGFGIAGTVENKKIIAGNAKLLEKFGIENLHAADEKRLAEKGNSIVYVAQDNKLIAMIGVNDIVRENAKEVIDFLNKNKINTVMLTGDNRETAEKIAERIGITEVISDVLPTQKAEVIRRLKDEKRYVMMCGDGINDSPALAGTDIGVSFNSGTDIAMDSSDVILTKNDLSSIADLINISRKTVRNIKQNLFWAFFYNLLMIPVAVGVLKPFGILINPMIASICMVFSSLTVILNALRLKKIKIHRENADN